MVHSWHTKITHNTLSTLGPTHETHKRHTRDFLNGIHTHKNRISLQTHDKIIPNTDLWHKVSDNTDQYDYIIIWLEIIIIYDYAHRF